jgi:protein subunit release factor A
MADWTEKIEGLRTRARALEERLSDPAVARQPAELAKAGKELSELRPLLEAGRRYEETLRGIEDARGLASDPDVELAELAKSELPALEARRELLAAEIRALLRPKDPNDAKDAILEIRAGAGGDEAALFAAELFRMYLRYAESRGWKVESLSESTTGSGGLKEAIAGVSGKDVYGRLKYERGVHRVQRVPATEGAGRIHTSTVTVAIMPEAEEVDLLINPADLRIDVISRLGPGRPEREHHRLGRARDAHPDRRGGLVPGREEPAQEQEQGAQGAARAPPRRGARASGGGARHRAACPGGHGRPQREDSHLQFPAEPHHRSPRGSHASPARPGHGG